MKLTMRDALDVLDIFEKEFLIHETTQLSYQSLKVEVCPAYGFTAHQKGILNLNILEMELLESPEEHQHLTLTC